MRQALCLIALCLATAPTFAAEPTELVDYVTKPDSSFSWKVADRTVTDLGTVYTLDLVSQTWHDIKWDHKLQVYVPKEVKPQATMVLWNQGGSHLGSSRTRIRSESERTCGVPFWCPETTALWWED